MPRCLPRGIASPKGIAARLVLSLLVLAVLTTWFTLISMHAYAANSDGATVLLEGSALFHGQPLLHGWSLSLDSFWTVDVLFYALAVAFVGVQPILMHLVPALLVALCVLVGASIAMRGRPVRDRLLAVGILVAALCLPDHVGAYFLLQGPWHVATTLYCLIVVLLLATGGFGWRWGASVALLALGLSGDLQMLAIGVVPVALAGLLAMVRSRSVRVGVDRLAAAAASCLVAVVVRIGAAAIGSFSVTENHHTVKAHQLLRDVGHFVNWITGIFGMHNGPVVGGSIAPIFVVLRAVVLVAVVAGCALALCHAVRALVRPAAPMASPDGAAEAASPPWLVDDLLLMMVFGAIALFGLLTLSNNTEYARYLDPVAIFASVLGARSLASLLARAPGRGWWLELGLLGLLVASCAASVVMGETATTPASPVASLERYLDAHHLERGIGDYWASSIVTVDSRQRIVIRPVVANPRGMIVPDGRQASIDWYRGQRFQFLVYERSPYGNVNRSTVEGTFGPPVDITRVGRYFVVTWAGPVSVTPHPYP